MAGAAGDGNQATEVAPASAPNEPVPETDRLITELGRTLQTLQTNEPEILNTLKQYRVELARRLADLRSSLARSGKSLDDVRAATDATDLTAVRVRRVDRRCSELRVYIGKLQATRERVRLLIEDHQYVLTDLQTKERVDQLADPALLDKARNLLARAGDQSELSPQNILQAPALAVAMADAEKQTAAAVSRSMLPDRPEKTLDDLPPLPELEVTAEGQAEEFLLADLKDYLATGKAAAENHLTANRPEAAIESLHEALQQIRAALLAYVKTKTLKWQAQCIGQLDAAQKALSEQLAGPYLQAVAQAIPQARKSGDWSDVLDLLEAIVRLAPVAEKLPDTLATVDTILQYRRNADDFDAVVAWERLQEIKALLTGTPYRPVSFGPNPADERVLITDGVTLTFIGIPAGSFKMGDGENRLVDVTLTSSYWMLKTEVTQAMYNLFAKQRPWRGKEYVIDGADYPMVYVSALDADAWCQKATAELRRQNQIAANETIALPTEAQWEYAARAGTTTAYFFGNDASLLGKYAWYDKNAWDIGQKYAHQAGLKKPNPWGLLDICGNVWEWCADCYQSELRGGANPRVSHGGSSRVCRGGSFSFHREAFNYRVGYRGKYDRWSSSCNIGFRVVLLAE